MNLVMLNCTLRLILGRAIEKEQAIWTLQEGLVPSHLVFVSIA